MKRSSPLFNSANAFAVLLLAQPGLAQLASGFAVSGLPNGISQVAPFPQAPFCASSGLASATGAQFKTGRGCVSTPQGNIPAASKMRSTLIIQPEDGAELDAAQSHTVLLASRNVDSGFFSDPDTQYYVIPQTLLNGVTQGHVHVAMQLLDGKVPDPQVTAFFLGVNTAGQSLSAVVPAGTITAPGVYRICTITGAAGHQPALSPIQERGPQDDCIRVKFRVSANVVANSNSATNSGAGESIANLAPCRSPVNGGVLCTTSGAGKSVDKSQIIALCNECAKFRLNQDTPNKLADCMAKVNGGDRNPKMPLNTFGRENCPPE